MAKEPLFYTTHTRNEHGYSHTRVFVFAGCPVPIAEKIAGCIDNAAGYGGGIETANELLKEFSALRADGVTHLIDPSYSFGPSVVFDFQHFETLVDGTQTYCSPSFEVGSRYSQIKPNTKLLLRIARKAGRRTPDSFETPDEVVATIEALGARRVAYAGAKHPFTVLARAS